MRLSNIAYIFLTLSLAVDSAGAIKPPAPDEPPEDEFIRHIAEENGWTSFPDDPGLAVERALLTEALVYSKRLEGSGAEIYRITKHIEGVGAGSDIPQLIEVRESDGIWFARKIPPEEMGGMAAEGKLSEHGLTAEEFADGLRAGAAGALVLGAGMESEAEDFDVFGDLPGMDHGWGIIRSVASPISGDYSDCARPTPGYDPVNEPWTSPAPGLYEFTEHRSGLVSTSPAILMAGNACFLLFAADAIDAARAMPEEEKAAAAQASAEFLEKALKEMHYIGEEDVRGHPSHGVGTDNAGISETADDQQVDINSMNVWIDAETFVRRKTEFCGVITSKAKSQDFCMQQIYDDYRNVPNTMLYEPYQEIIGIGGMMTPEQKKELQEAEAELGDYESQLAELPPSQQAMMRRMIEPQIERMQALARGNTTEIEIITTAIEIGPDFGSPSASPVMADEAANEAEAEAIKAARQACLEQKMADAGQAQPDGPDTRELAGAAKRTAMSVASGDLTGLIAGFFVSGQTKKDIGTIAEALGLSKEDVVDCQDP